MVKMNMNTNWCIEGYRDHTMPLYKWILQKSFIEHYKHLYPEERVVSLSQCYLNIAFLGSFYSPPVMTLVRSLICDVPLLNRFATDDSFRLSFISKPNQSEDGNQLIPIAHTAQKTKSGKRKRKHNASVQQHDATSNINFPSFSFDVESNCESIIRSVRSQNGIRGKLILYCTGNISNMKYNDLHSSAAALSLNVSVVETDSSHLQASEVEYSLIIDSEVICSRKYDRGIKANSRLKDAKESLGSAAISLLQNHCFTIERLNGAGVSVSVIDKNGEFVGDGGSITQQQSAEPDERLSDRNCSIGAKMMRKMGWTGGGLGSEQQGRKDIIEASMRVNRSGLGTANVCNALRDMIRNYAKSDSIQNLIFSTDFSKEERAVIHNLARQFQLKASSHGSGKNRQLTIRRVTNRWKLVEILLKNSGRTNDYKLVYPKKFNTGALRFDP